METEHRVDAHGLSSPVKSTPFPYLEYRKTSDRSPRLLSVQLNQTPGLYAGPGVYSGPGLYHNMSLLCYFIQIIVNFHVYRVYQYFVCFLSKTSHIENVQKMATKFIISLKKYSYNDRLMQLNVSTLKYRRLRWDMIEVLKIVKQKYDNTIVPKIPGLLREGTTINY